MAASGSSTNAARMTASRIWCRGEVMTSNQASTTSSVAAAAEVTARYREHRSAKYPVAPKAIASMTSKPTHAML